MAVPRLLELAREQAGAPRKTALQALASLANEREVPALVELASNYQDEADRAEAAETLRATLQRVVSRDRRVDLAPLGKAVENGPSAVRISLLPVCSGLSDAELRRVLRSAVADSGRDVRAAAVRALCDSHDLALLPDLEKVACTAPEENFRSLATAACVRLTSQDEGAKLADAARLAPLKAVLASQPSTAQKRMVLAGLAEIPDPDALALSQPLLEEAGIQAEAARAVIKIASTLPGAEEAPTAALKKVLASTTDSDTRQAAEAALKAIQARTEFITAWQVTGPYRESGKNYADLFDIVFPPETATSERIPPRGTALRESNTDTTSKPTVHQL